MKRQNAPTMPERRKLLVAGAGIAAASLIPHVSAASQSSQVDSSRQPSQRNAAPGKRKLGKLEVSAVGLGVQNMSRKYDTSVPRRPEMINVIRRAFDEGVTFFDAAEAYGPFEVEKILGEGVAPFRDKIVIATKFGWNIDQQTESVCRALTAGRSISGRSSKTCSNACVPIVSIYCTNTGLIHRSRSKMSPVW